MNNTEEAFLNGIKKLLVNDMRQKKSKWIQKKLLLIFNDEEPFEIHNDAKFKIFDKELTL